MTEMREYIFPMMEGEMRLLVPSPMCQESFELMIETVKRLERGFVRSPVTLTIPPTAGRDEETEK